MELVQTSADKVRVIYKQALVANCSAATLHRHVIGLVILKITENLTQEEGK